MGIILGSTMVGPVKVCVPIGNALGDSARPRADSQDLDQPVAIILIAVLFL